MKRILILSLAVLAIFSMCFGVSASIGQAAIPIWVDCRGAHPHGSIEVGASLGQDSVVVSWTSPTYDWIVDLKCNVQPFTQSEVTIAVYGTPYPPAPTTVLCHSTSCSDVFTVMVIKQYCVGHTCIGRAVPYNLQYGNDITVEVTTTYAGYEEHFGSYTLAVTD